MEEGLFGSLSGNEKIKKYKANGPSNLEFSNSIAITGWDGSPLPLSQSLKDASIMPTSMGVGLPEKTSSAPWEYGQPMSGEQNNQSTNTQSQQQVQYQQQMYSNQQKDYNQFNNNNNNQKQDIPQANMYSYPSSNNMQYQNNNNNFVGNHEQLRMNAYTQQKEQSQQVFQKEIFDKMYQQSIPGQNKNEQNLSGLDPYNEGFVSYGNTGINIQNPNDSVIIDRVANLKYINAGRHNLEPYSSQYGLCDVPHSEWVKATTIAAIPFLNLIYLIYIGYIKSFIKYPMMKDWSRGNIINAILINIAWVISIFALLLT